MNLLRRRTRLCALSQLCQSYIRYGSVEARLLPAGVPEAPSLLRGFAQLVSFPLAQTGEGISECELVAWAVKPGDVVGPFDKLCDVQSDKAAIEITSRYGGKVLALHHVVGAMVKVGAPLVDIEVADDVQVAPEHIAGAAGAEAGTATPAAAAATVTSATPVVLAAAAPTPGATVANGGGAAVTVTTSKAAVQVTSAATPAAAVSAPAASGRAQSAGAPGQPTARSWLPQQQQQQQQQPPQQPQPPRGRPQASPAVRAFAREQGVNLTAVTGTAPGGRVTRADVEAYVLQQQQQRGGALAGFDDEEDEEEVVLQAIDFLTPVGAATKTATAAAAGGAGGGGAGSRPGARPRPGSAPTSASLEELLEQYRRTTAATSQSAPAAVGEAGPRGEGQLVPLRGYRRAMVASMTAAASLPLFHFHDELVLDRLLAVREAMKGDPGLRSAGGKLTVLPLIVKALSAALTRHPLLNASLAASGTEVVLHPHHNIGVAMATPWGLVVPNIKQVERKSVAAVATELLLLQQLAVAGRLPPEALSGGTITISNIGTIGGTYATPLVSAPEVAIVALGRLQVLPRYPKHTNPYGPYNYYNAPSAAAPPNPSDSVAAGTQGHRLGWSGEGAALPRPVPVSVLPISWGADHRVVDGAALASFSNTWKELLEAPERLLLHLA